MSTPPTKALTDKVFDSMREEVDAFFDTHDSITSSLEYENKIFELAQKFAVQMVNSGVGKLPKDRNLKKKC